VVHQLWITEVAFEFEFRVGKGMGEDMNSLEAPKIFVILNIFKLGKYK
jgi:hypothetical protein